MPMPSEVRAPLAIRESFSSTEIFTISATCSEFSGCTETDGKAPSTA
jgi:hypothetical protein